MKVILATFALAIAAPAVAQPAAQSDGHAQHQQQGQQSPSHDQHRQGERDGCPCCRPRADGTRPDCCAEMHRQHDEHRSHQGH